ncbi:MAG: transketolase family protein [Parcubacteria group bacterium]|nr:transketolase family protein [Parcubacteria group bacterium]MCR4342619.1 transketolase family protein [Patescibacteria group bacterium]
MLNPDQKLNPKLLDKDVEQTPIRFGYGDGLLMAGDENPNIVALCADLTDSTKTSTFSKKFPERFVEMGIGEQSMASVASGMAAMGKVPFIASYAMFSPGRNWEQIRTTICYNNSNVKVAGAHAGISVGPDGGTHQAIEDIAITRVIPRMNVVVPCDAIEAKKATYQASKIEGPFYLRFAREPTPIVTTEESPFEVGKANLLRDDEDPQVVIIACGPSVYNSLMAAEELAKEGIGCLVLNNHTIKPMDEVSVIDIAKKAGRVVTVEEHQVLGGMGSAVAEVLAKNYPVPMEFVGVEDKFGQSGTQEELVEHYGMGINGIKDAVRKVIKLKGND